MAAPIATAATTAAEYQSAGEGKKNSAKGVRPICIPHIVVALAGNPNSGKSTVFNRLTGLHQKVANYPGVTVEHKTGYAVLSSGGERKETTPARPMMTADVFDLPGAYSLVTRSLDEEVARDVLLGRMPGAARPDVIVVVVDASSLTRSLYLVTQAMELGRPVVVALNMIDVAAATGIEIDATALAGTLRVPVVPMVARKGKGIDELRAAIVAAERAPAPSRLWSLPDAVEREVANVASWLHEQGGVRDEAAEGEAIRLLLSPPPTGGAFSLTSAGENGPDGADLDDFAAAARADLADAGVPLDSLEADCRYAFIARTVERATARPRRYVVSASDRIDAVVTHRVFGPLLFVLVMAAMFMTIFSFAEWPVALITSLVEWLAGMADAAFMALHGRAVAAGWIAATDWLTLKDLIVGGVITDGVGAVVVFVPPIALLFLFIGLLEDSGYLARAAFIVDRLMKRVGLHGKAFIPLLSSFACAVPGIMATRTIENRRDRLVTILIAPLMSCSARLPVYVMLIAAFVPPALVIGFLPLQGLVFFSMYLLGMAAAFAAAWTFKRTILKGKSPPLILELPQYKMPSARNVAITVWDNTLRFLARAGTLIFALSILIWFLKTYPRVDEAPYLAAFGPEPAPEQVETARQRAAAAQLEQSALGRIGRGIEPLFRPLGFDWKVCVGVAASFAAREVFVSTMAQTYVLPADVDAGSVTLIEKIRGHLGHDRGAVPAVTLMVFYVLAMQCLSTLAVVKRETGSWRWPAFMFAYMSVLAYAAAFAARQIGLALTG
ncbi:MAG: ferrous iron transport protein B [Planctomycetes bacterium]|nr:ferrous iron transport protein B [Planctomycetota bacterium]